MEAEKELASKNVLPDQVINDVIFTHLFNAVEKEMSKEKGIFGYIVTNNNHKF